MHCNYCGEEQPVPDAAARSAVLRERERERARDEKRLAEKKEEQRTERWWIVGVLVFAAVSAIAGIIFGNVNGSSPTNASAPKPTDDESTGKNKVKANVHAALARGCRVVNEARSADDVLTVSDWKLPHHACVTIVAATGIADVTLTLQFTDNEGNPLKKPMTGKELEALFCSPATAKYGYTITPSTPAPFTYEELQCADE